MNNNQAQQKSFKIGVITSKHENVMGITLPYFNFLDYFATEVVLINPLSDEVNTGLDLLVLPGGADIDPSRYGAKPNRYCGKPNLDLEWFDKNMLPRYINETNIPILGICRGGQTLNVTYGGVLTQHNNYANSPNRVEYVDKLNYIAPQSFLRFTGMSVKELPKMVNGMHHQGWYQAPDGFDIIAVSEAHKNVEAMYNAGRNVLAVQYHPEEIWCELVMSWIEKLKNNKQ